MSKFVLTAQLQLQAPNNIGQIVQQIQNQLNGVNINVQVQNSQQAQRQLQQITQHTNQATSAAERMGRAFALSIRRFAAFSIATRAVGLFTSTLSDAIQTSIDFERQLIKVSQVTGKSIGQLRGLTKQITDLSTGFGVASSDLLNVSTILAQAGLSAEDTAVALKTLAKSALAPNFDSITETAEGAIAVLAQFQEGVGSLEKQLGSINAVAGAFAVEAGDLIDVIRRTGGVFKASGGDLNELLALFTSVRATTRESAESIGTGLRTIFTRIQRPKTIEFLKQFGVELVDLDGKFVGPYEAVKRLSEALAGLGEGDTTFIRIAEELGGFRQIGKVLPLLQQFSTAQSALNVAMKAGDSLTQDAASAQAALAVRIMKVKEEFLALIRSITETSTFQVMANTALSLASALIKIGDSIKPLLPLLAGLAAFRLAKGLGGFFGGIMNGAVSGRTYNKGGKVLGFARGGLVPGSGNRDTVPAMLSPGEFVIRKSSVNKMGAGNLAAMNNNRYAMGGIVGGIGLTPTNEVDSGSGKVSVGDIIKTLLTNSNLPGGTSGNKKIFSGVNSSKQAAAIIANIGGFAGTGPAISRTFTAKGQSFKDANLNTMIGNDVELGMKNLISNAASVLGKSIGVGLSGSPSSSLIKSIGSSDVMGKIFEGALNLLGAPFDPLAAKQDRDVFDFPSGLGGPLGSYFQGFEKIPVDAKKHLTPAILDDIATRKTKNFIAGQVNMSQQFQSLKKSKLEKAHLGGLIQKFAEGGEVLERGTQKYLISDVVKGMRELQGNPVLSQKDAIDLFNSKDARGDFIYSNFGGPGSIKLPKWMGTYRPQSAAYGAFQKAQADKQNRIAGAMSRQGKTMRDYETRREFATGGGVGTDTVPAMLTPGEFVVNRSSAQRIGYGNLNRMNKVGKYAKGGMVQYFSNGASGTGVAPPSGGAAPQVYYTTAQQAATLGNACQSAATQVQTISTSTQQVVQANNDQRRSVGDVVNSNKMFAVSMATSLLQGFLPAVDENSGVVLRATHNLMGLVTTVASVGFALEAFGLQLNMKSLSGLKDLFSGGKGGLGDKIAGVQQTSVGVGRRSGQAVGEAFQNARKSANIDRSIGRVRADAAQLPIKDRLGPIDPMQQNARDMYAQKLRSLRQNKMSIPKADSLTGKLGDFLGKKSLAGGTTGRLAGYAAAGINKVGGSAVAQGAIALLPQFTKLIPVIGTLITTFQILKGIADAFGDRYKQQMQNDIKAGNVESAGKNARAASNFSSVGTGASLGGIAGGIIGSFAGGPVGAAIGASLGAAVGGFLSDPFGNLADEAANVAMAQAGAVRSSKALDAAGLEAARAMNDFKNGTKSALDVLNTFKPAAAEQQAQRGRVDAVVKQTTEGKSRGLSRLGRNILTYAGGGLFGMEAAGTRNKRLTSEGVDAVKTQRESEAQFFEKTSEARNASIRSVIARGGSRSDVEAKLKERGFESSSDMRARVASMKEQSKAAMKNGDLKLAQQLDLSWQELENRSKDLDNAFNNIELEVKRAKEAFDALNLGLRSPAATAVALSASLERFSAGLEVGGSTFVSDVEFLQQSLSSAAQALDPNEIKGAVKSVSSNLRQFGASEEYIKKFEGNISAFTQAQANYNKAFSNIKQSMADKDFQNLSAEDLKKKFGDELTKGLGPDVSQEAKDNLKKVINNLDLDTGDVDKILSGDLSAFGDKLSESQKKMLEDVQKIAAERAKAEQVLIDFTKKRIDAERNLVQAQQEALELVMEGREIQGKYGGRAVTGQERKDNLLAKSNAESNRLGLTAMRTGDTGELRRRNAEIRNNFAATEARRTQRGGMSNRGGVQADESQKDLEKAYKTQIDTIRSLIKLEEEQLKITQEKNKLEKESMESLVKGDVEEFFKKQSAVGATAAIASGDTRLQNLYGADALGTAFQDIQRQQEAGVQSLYGQQLAGPGGLTEAAANAALSSRGITDMRSAQVMAGTSPEEEASKARLRELGGVLGETGQVGTDIAEMKVETSVVNLNAATVKFNDTMDRGNQKAKEAQDIENRRASGMARGGVVYANRGIFVPRGTDTIPAMLTPGEFVVNRAAVQRGNNLQLLKAMNNGSGGVSNTSGGAALMATGGVVRYRSEGSNDAEKGMSTFTAALNTFNQQLSENVKSLSAVRLQIKLDTTNVNINFSGAEALASMTKQVKDDVLKQVMDKIGTLRASTDGELKQNTGVLPRT
jgi:TP901 family phage tail tape measure protein